MHASGAIRGPDVERLVAGRERMLLDRFYNELSANPPRANGRCRCWRVLSAEGVVDGAT